MKRFASFSFLLVLTIKLDAVSSSKKELDTKESEIPEIDAVSSSKKELDTEESEIPEIGYQGTIFSKPGLVWIDFDPLTVKSKLMYAPLLPDTWHTEGIKTHTIDMVIGEDIHFTHLALDFHNRTLVLADQLNQRIGRITFSDYDEPVYEVLFTGTSKHVNGITVDWVTDVVYWTDAAYDAIIILGLKDPHVAEMLVQQDLDEPYGIVAYPTQTGGYLFWSDIGVQPKIERALLSGRKRKTIYPRDTRSRDETPTVLLVDPETDRLYWLTKSGLVASSDLDGKEISWFSTSEEDYFDMDMFHGQRILSYQGSSLSQSSREDMASLSMPGNHHKNEIHIYGPMKEDRIPIRCYGVPYGVQVIDPNRQTNMYNPCIYSSCPGICIKSGWTECICSEYLRIQAGESEEKSFCDRRTINAILLAKSDGIYHLERNFADRTLDDPAEALTRVFPYRNHITAITSMIETNSVYFYDAVLKVIGKVALSGLEPSNTISLAVDSVGDLAVDWIRGNLYWTEVMFGQIVASTVDGTFPVPVVQNLVQPRAIVIQAKAGYLFWTDTGLDSIERAYLDGSRRETLKYGYRVIGFAIDMEKDVTGYQFAFSLYWTDSRSSAIYSSDFDAYNIRQLHVIPTNFPGFAGLAVVNLLSLYRESEQYGNSRAGRYVNRMMAIEITRQDVASWSMKHLHPRDPPIVNFCSCQDSYNMTKDYLVWSDNNWTSPRGVFAIDRIRGGYVGGYRGFQNTYDIIFHHRSNQPQGSPGACFSADCAQLCLPQGTRARCACTVGFKLGHNNKSCERTYIDPMYIHFVLADQRLQRIFLIPLTDEYISLPFQHIKQPYAVAYDSLKNMIYWTDLEDRTISRANTNGSFQQILASGQYFMSLAIDVEHRMLYYTAQSVHTIFGTLVVMRLDTLKSKVLNYIPSPRTLAINPEKGYVFIADEPMSSNGSTPPSHIWRANMDGSNLTTIFKSDMPFNGLASQFEYVFFTMKGDNNINKSDLNGENASIFVRASMPLSLAVDMERFYWIDGIQRSILSCRLSDCSSIRGFGHIGLFVKPTGFATYFKEDLHLEAHEYCIPTPAGLQCSESGFVAEQIETSGGFCEIPEIYYGDIIDNKPGHVVPDGYTTYVQCFPLHKTLKDNQMVCTGGSWSNIPKCHLEYEICGTIERGYKIYRESGFFYVFRGITQLSVLLIGGGGGGYDIESMDNDTLAGNGETSSFGAYLHAAGGSGGSLFAGGKGGLGMTKGGGGGYGGNCTAGGAAGQRKGGLDLEPGYSFNTFCGTGGLSAHCEKFRDQISAETTAPWATRRNISNAGQYGGGSGSRGGGAGGGGGFTEGTIAVKHDDVVTVTVGKGGKPSYAEAGQGIVVVAWGQVSIDKNLEKVQRQYNCTRIDER